MKVYDKLMTPQNRKYFLFLFDTIDSFLPCRCAKLKYASWIVPEQRDASINSKTDDFRNVRRFFQRKNPTTYRFRSHRRDGEAITHQIAQCLLSLTWWYPAFPGNGATFDNRSADVSNAGWHNFVWIHTVWVITLGGFTIFPDFFTTSFKNSNSAHSFVLDKTSFDHDSNWVNKQFPMVIQSLLIVNLAYRMNFKFKTFQLSKIQKFSISSRN